MNYFVFTSFVPVLLSAAKISSFQVGGYVENWKRYDDLAPFSTVYYSFLTLDPHPDPDSPHAKVWNGKAVYESMSAADVIDVMTKTDPAWKNQYNWQREKIQKLMDTCAKNNQVFMWSIGGWSDLKGTITDAQIPVLVSQVLALLKLGGDGVDFDWEHLSNFSHVESVTQQQRHVLGKLIKKLRQELDANGMKQKHISYTTRWNCFWDTDEERNASHALQFPSDGECLDTFSEDGASSDDVSWVNLMMYDAAPYTAFVGKAYFTLDTYKTVLEASSRVLPPSKIIMGFEPGSQAGKAIWEGFDIDFEVIDYMKKGGFGGVMFWATNEDSAERNPQTPKSIKWRWQGGVFQNALLIARNVNVTEYI